LPHTFYNITNVTFLFINIGEACESEVNACDTKPCSQGQDCTDLTAAVQGNSSIGHTCGACPSGTTKVNGLCEGRIFLGFISFHRHFCTK
jgi:hypothetical protein